MRTTLVAVVLLLAALATSLAVYFGQPLGVSVPANRTGTGNNAEDAGEAEAERDIKAGTLKRKEYGYPPRWAGLWSDLMKERLGVELELVGDCVVTDEVRANAKGYNRRMNQEIERRFGPGAVEALFQEAREKHEATRADAKKTEP
jgi:hypothetical protein